MTGRAGRRSSFGNVQPSGRSGMYRARYKGPDGSSHSRSGFVTQRAARSFLSQMQSDIERGVWRNPRVVPVDLVSLESWSAERMRLHETSHKLSTQDLYAGLLRRHILPALGGMPLDQLTSAVVRHWHHELSTRTGPVAVRQSYSLLKTILAEAVRDQVLPRNPCQVVGAGQSMSRARPFVSREAAEAVANALPGQLGTLIMIKFWSSLRLGELLALRRSDVVLRQTRDGQSVTLLRVTKSVVRVGPTLIVSTPKTLASVRDVPLPSQAAELLRRHLAATQAGATSADVLFPGDSGCYLKAHQVRVPFKRALADLGMSDFHLHDLRHGGLTHAGLCGATIGQLQSRAGHASARMVAHYQRQGVELDDRLALAMSDDE